MSSVGTAAETGTDVRPFHVEIPEEQLAELRRRIVEAVYPRLAYCNEVDKGGHFAAWEAPELFSTEIRAAFSSLR